MPLDLPDGDRCFVDAKIFYYHFVETPPLSEPCVKFLERAARGQLVLHTSVHILSEAIHKVMLFEAATVFGQTRTNLVNWLRRHQDRITELSEFRQAAGELAGMGLSLLPADAALLAEAATLSAQLGLLTNDATIVALMHRHALTNLVTNDDDFDAVPGLTVWKPR
jgi:predicted nucleic acid-binding protein